MSGVRVVNRQRVKVVVNRQFNQARGDTIARRFGYTVDKQYASGTGYVGPHGYGLFIARNGDWESSVIGPLGSYGSAGDLAAHLSAIHRSRNKAGRIAPVYEVFAGGEQVYETADPNWANANFQAYVDLSKGKLPSRGGEMLGRSVTLTKDDKVMKEYSPTRNVNDGHGHGALQSRLGAFYEVFAGGERVYDTFNARQADLQFKAYVDLSKGNLPSRGGRLLGTSVTLTKDDQVQKEYTP